jgi:hypothetical protein
MLRLITAAATFALIAGCALAPDSIRPEIEHMSHATQHAPLTDHPTHDAVNMFSIIAHWDVKNAAYLEIGEGFALNRQVSSGTNTWCGEIAGPREEFTARVGLIIPVRKP